MKERKRTRETQKKGGKKIERLGKMIEEEEPGILSKTLCVQVSWALRKLKAGRQARAWDRNGQTMKALMKKRQTKDSGGFRNRGVHVSWGKVKSEGGTRAKEERRIEEVGNIHQKVQRKRSGTFWNHLMHRSKGKSRRLPWWKRTRATDEEMRVWEWVSVCCFYLLHHYINQRPFAYGVRGKWVQKRAKALLFMITISIVITIVLPAEPCCCSFSLPNLEQQASHTIPHNWHC